jgi:hypothetical protein
LNWEAGLVTREVESGDAAVAELLHQTNRGQALALTKVTQGAQNEASFNAVCNNGANRSSAYMTASRSN